jgi:anti-sigma regulatory factor (Ser/Thr protein kinase)
MRIVLGGDVRAPAAARRFVGSAGGQLLGDGDSPQVDDVVLAVSELVTNSVRAGATQIQLTLDVADDSVELHVSDDAPGWPAVRHPDLDDPGGRGLAIVEDVADEWHATGLDRGKRVTVRWSRTTGEAPA